MGSFFGSQPAPATSGAGYSAAPAVPAAYQQYFNPADLKRQAMFRAMQMAGVGLLGQGATPYRPSFLGQLAPGFAGAMQGADQARQDWWNQGRAQLELGQMAQQEKRADQEALWKEEERQAKLAAEAARKTQLSTFRATLPATEQQLFDVDPDAYVSGTITSRFDKDKPREMPTDLRVLAQINTERAAKGMPPLSTEEYMGQKKGAGITYTDKDGNTIQIGGSGGKPLTESQSKDVGYAIRAEGANPLIEKYGDALLSAGKSFGGQLPGVGNYIKGYGDADYQLAEQAGNEFLTALLRKESGATITPAEQSLYGTIFLPQPFDRPEVGAQKKEARKRAIAGINAGLPPLAILEKEKALAAGKTDAGASSDAPSDVPQDVWDAMTAEEKALWK